jgi:hypothetical protein
LHIKNNPFLNPYLEGVAPFTPHRTSEVISFLRTIQGKATKRAQI